MHGWYIPTYYVIGCAMPIIRYAHNGQLICYDSIEAVHTVINSRCVPNKKKRLARLAFFFFYGSQLLRLYTTAVVKTFGINTIYYNKKLLDQKMIDH